MLKRSTTNAIESIVSHAEAEGRFLGETEHWCPSTAALLNDSSSTCDSAVKAHTGERACLKGHGAPPSDPAHLCVISGEHMPTSGGNVSDSTRQPPHPKLNISDD